MVAVGADNILNDLGYVAAGFNVGPAQIPRDLASDALCHFIRILVDLFIVDLFLLLGRDFLGAIRFLNTEQIQPYLL